MKQAHVRLYEYYKNKPEQELPDTLEKMEPLFAAVMHGCHAGRYQEALDEVYRQRIQRNQGKSMYIRKELGAWGTDLTALAGFFHQYWDQTRGWTD